MIDSRLAGLPLALFGAPMGLCGLGLAWRSAVEPLGAPWVLGEGMLALGVAVWLALVAAQGLRAVRFPARLWAEAADPLRGVFVGAVTIGGMLVAGALEPYATGFARGLWAAAACAHLAVATITLRGLMTAPRPAAALTPALLIPLVGNIVAPAIGARLGVGEVGWVLFGIGAFLWMALHPILLARLVMGPALPEGLRPTLTILLAPPAVGAIALAQLAGGHGVAALAMWGAAALVALALLANLRGFLALPFGPSAWAYTFPAAAFALATMEAAAAHAPGWLALAWVPLLAASAILAAVSLGTLRSAARGRLY